jgi:hypothetical protein
MFSPRPLPDAQPIRALIAWMAIINGIARIKLHAVA